jgi:hypothetical protein
MAHASPQLKSARAAPLKLEPIWFTLMLRVAAPSAFSFSSRL